LSTDFAFSPAGHYNENDVTASFEIGLPGGVLMIERGYSQIQVNNCLPPKVGRRFDRSNLNSLKLPNGLMSVKRKTWHAVESRKSNKKHIRRDQNAKGKESKCLSDCRRSIVHAFRTIISHQFRCRIDIRTGIVV
jgi:hypothetical protein